MVLEGEVAWRRGSELPEASQCVLTASLLDALWAVSVSQLVGFLPSLSLAGLSQ